ncbi:MAG TPA: hypothetical protein VM370_09135 [Candidatus Thermoplasmatota archaeon]|nr:hypothetical protein [Candidatus Thermoplasmatota archaeon]
MDRAALWTRTGPIRPPASPDREHAIYPVSHAEIMELIACDTPRWGAPRGPTLAALIARQPHRAFAAVKREGGAFCGHVIGGAQGVEVLVADTAAAAAWLLHAAERAGTPGRAVVPAGNARAAPVFEAAGYARGGFVDGEPSSGRPETHYALPDHDA